MLVIACRNGLVCALLMLLVAVPLLAAPTTDGPSDAREFLGPRFDHNRKARDTVRVRSFRRYSGVAADTLRYWNGVAVDASGLDHTPVQAGETREFGEQLGPGRSARAMAIVHIAMFDAVNSILGGYTSYTGIAPAPRGASIDAAIAQAAHDTLVAMFPSQRSHFSEVLANDLKQISVRDSRARYRGIAAGKRAAAAILKLRSNDHSGEKDPLMGSEWITHDAPGHWRQDPIGQSPIALGAKWGEVQPFVLGSVERFRAPPPPALDSEEYAAAYEEAKAMGGDGITTPTQRTDDQTQIGIFWAYDGTPSLCAPPRLYNQLVAQISERSNDVLGLARLFALVNVALADAGIAIWESKFLYDVWRPVTGIREEDGNPATIGDETFVPFGAPATNLTGPNFTPPFPAYPSGHAGFGGALFQILRRFYGTDRVPFTFVSDELNGETIGSDGEVRPLVPRTFQSFSQAEEENGQSRIYLGIHWAFDKTEGIEQGRRVANYIYNHAFRPARR